jgi:lysophospholipase L1-like esterase
LPLSSRKKFMMRKKQWMIFMVWGIFSLSVIALLAGCGPKTWDYVALGASITSGHGVETSYVDLYAEFIEQDLGVEVEVHNFGRYGESVATLLNRLRNNEELREAVQGAEVITIFVGWNDVCDELVLYGREECGGDDNLECIREEVSTMKSDFEEVFDEILSLTSAQDTLIRVAENNIPYMNSWLYKGWFDTLREPGYEEWRKHLISAAEERGLTVVYTYHVLNGPNGDQPMDESITQSGGTLPNEEGHRLIARLHREAGYEYAP